MAIHIDKSKDGQYYYTVTGGNNEVLNTSEMVKTKQSIKKSIRALQNADLFTVKDHTVTTKPNIKKPK